MRYDPIKPTDYHGHSKKDSTEVLQRAVRDASAEECCLDLGCRTYSVSESIGVIKRPCSIVGHGIGVTSIHATEELQGSVLTVLDTADSGRAGIGLNVEPSSPKITNKGVTLAGFKITGNRLTEQTGITLRGVVDSLVMRDVMLSYFNGPGLRVAAGRKAVLIGSLRESHIENLQIVHCGNSLFAALHWDEADLGDGSNQTTFNNLRIVYPRGVGMLLRNIHQQPVRRLCFNSVMIHGMPDEVIADHGIPQASTLLKIQGNVMACDFTSLRLNHWSQHAIYLLPYERLKPRDCVFDKIHAIQGENAIREVAGVNNVFVNVRPAGTWKGDD